MTVLNYPVSFEGLISAYAASRQQIAVAAANGMVTGWMLRRTDDLTNVVDVALVRDGGYVGLPFTIPAGEAVADGSFVDTNVTQGQKIELEVQGFPNPPSGMNLNGYLTISYELMPLVGFGDLTTLARVKAFLKLTDDTFDSYLAQQISDTSDRMQRWMERNIEGEVVTGEKRSSAGLYELTVNGYPIKSIEEVRVYGSAVASVDFDVASGSIFQTTSDGVVLSWPQGIRHIEVDYTYGYASVPLDLQDAATRQVAWDFSLSKQDNQARLGLSGTVLATGGTSDYDTTDEGWIRSVESVMARYKRLPEPV